MISYRYPRPVLPPAGNDPRQPHRPFYPMTGGDLIQPVPQHVSRSRQAANANAPISEVHEWETGEGATELNAASEAGGDLLPIVADEDEDNALVEALLLQRLQALRSQADWGRGIGARNPAYGANLWHNLGNVLAPTLAASIHSKKLSGEE